MDENAATPSASMSLTPGTRLGPYEIVSSIGAGGAPAAVASERSEPSQSAWGWGPMRIKRS